MHSNAPSLPRRGHRNSRSEREHVSLRGNVESRARFLSLRNLRRRQLFSILVIAFFAGWLPCLAASSRRLYVSTILGYASPL